MECLNCKISNPEGNRFCGSCGAELSHETFDRKAFLRDELPRQIEQAISAKLSGFTDREAIELKATEQIIDRVWKWVTRLATVIIGGIAVIAVALGIWGVKSYEDFQKLKTEAETKLLSASSTAEEIEARAESATKKLASFNAEVATLSAQAETAKKTLAEATKTIKSSAETINQAEKLNQKFQEILQNSRETVDAFSQRAQKLDKELAAVTKKVSQLDDLTKQTAGFVTAAGNAATLEGDVKTSSDRVTARVRFDEAYEETDPAKQIDLYTQAIDLDPEYADAFFNRGIAHGEIGENGLAIADYDKAIELDPSDAAALINRGVAYGEIGENGLAIADYGRAIELDPSYALAFINRGIDHSEMDNHALAIADFDKAIELNPDDADAFYNRGEAYRQSDDYDRAIADYGRAIDLDPSAADAYNGKAWLLATAEDAKLRDGTEAVRLAREAVRLGNEPDDHDTLAAAYAETGQFDDAVAEQERAIEMLQAADRTDEIAVYQSRLTRYQNHKPYRE